MMVDLVVSGYERELIAQKLGVVSRPSKALRVVDCALDEGSRVQGRSRRRHSTAIKSWPPPARRAQMGLGPLVYPAAQALELIQPAVQKLEVAEKGA
jgi:hypothetical protein